MKRRHYLAAALSALLAGCSGSGNTDVSTPRPEPEYEELSETAYLLSVEDLPEGWTRTDEYDSEFDAVFVNTGETAVARVRAKPFETVPEARKEFKDDKTVFMNPAPLSLGDESFWAASVESALPQSGTRTLSGRSRVARASTTK